MKSRRLFHSFREGRLGCGGQLEDYAVYALALLELYRAAFQAGYLENAAFRARQMMELFEDRKQGGYFISASDAEQLIARPMETYDGAVPSGNSAAAMVLHKLPALTGEKEWQDAAKRQLAYCAHEGRDYPMGHAYALLALAEALYPHKELVCAARGGLTERLKKQFKDAPAYGLDILLRQKRTAPCWKDTRLLRRIIP